MSIDFKKRVLQFQFILGKGSFGENGANVYTTNPGFRAQCSILKAGGNSLGNANVRIYGLPLSLMNTLSTLGMPITQVRKNSLLIFAGNEDEKLANIFQGTITNAYVDGEDQPNVALVVEAFVGAFDAVKTPTPSSYEGTADVVNVLQGICSQANITLVNNGVSVPLTNTYLSGSIYDQIKEVCKNANINYHLDAEPTAQTPGQLSIWSKNGSRKGDPIIISAATGMKGYPRFTGQGISLTILFNPAIMYGSLIEVESVLKVPTKRWGVYRLTYDLETQTPNGRWFCDIDAGYPGLLQLSK